MTTSNATLSNRARASDEISDFIEFIEANV